MDMEFVNRIIEVGKRQYCSLEDLAYFVPNGPGDSEIIRVRATKVPNSQLSDLVKGCHLIEIKYREKVKGDRLVFGSPSRVKQLIDVLETRNNKLARELYDWVASNGGDYYITSGVTYAENAKIEQNKADNRKKILLNDQKIHLEAVAKRKAVSDLHISKHKEIDISVPMKKGVL